MPIIIKDKSKCTGCFACKSICPANCISMISNGEGFVYPEVNTSKCKDCNMCVNVCPLVNSNKHISNCNNKAYAAVYNDINTRILSSSGGVFTALANYIIDSGGVVFGAAFDKDFIVRHTYIESKAELNRLRGSKYVQSMIDDAYKDAEKFLVNGRRVLFSGTPCQIEGLCSFLGIKYDNLFTVDLVCHGVPSPLVWQKYKDYLGKKGSRKIVDVNFRDKATGWKNYSVSFSFDNGLKYSSCYKDDIYMWLFLNNYSLRRSCFDCQYKKINRISDITLADFWGIDSIIPEMDDDKGTSMLIINSEKGESIFQRINDKLLFQPVDLETCFSSNYCYLNSVKKPIYRNLFFNLVQRNGIGKTYLVIRIVSYPKRVLDYIKQRIFKLYKFVSSIL